MMKDSNELLFCVVFQVASLSTFAVELGFLVEEYAGSKGAIPPRKHRKKKTLYVATIEKAHSLVNSLILDGRIETLGLVVVDEVRERVFEGIFVACRS